MIHDKYSDPNSPDYTPSKWVRWAKRYPEKDKLRRKKYEQGAAAKARRKRYYARKKLNALQ